MMILTIQLEDIREAAGKVRAQQVTEGDRGSCSTKTSKVWRLPKKSFKLTHLDCWGSGMPYAWCDLQTDLHARQLLRAPGAKATPRPPLLRGPETSSAPEPKMAARGLNHHSQRAQGSPNCTTTNFFNHFHKQRPSPS